MTDPTLTRQGSTFTFPSGATSITLYNATSENRRKSANLIILTMPRQDSTSSKIYDLLGVEGNWSYKGIVTAGDATLSTWLKDLEALVSGTQPGYTLTTQSISVSRTVKAENLTWSYVAGEPSSVEYTVELVDSS